MRLGDNSVPSLGEGTSLVDEVRQGGNALRRPQDKLGRNVARDLAQDVAVRRVASAVLEYVDDEIFRFYLLVGHVVGQGTRPRKRQVIYMKHKS